MTGLKKKLFKHLLFASVLAVSFSCKKGLPLSCYDAVYYQKHKHDGCTAECPGVVGCDGKTYCNLCEMHSNGIKKTK